METITLGGGCFWCTEAIFSELQGVGSVQSGYSGGTVANPTYEQVCTGRTGHAEVIQITFDPKVISLHDILTVFFTLHDPTTLNQQGADRGTQYRSCIFYRTPEQQQVAEEVMQEISAEHLWPNPLVTTLEPFTEFYLAETYHQAYYQTNRQAAYCQVVIAPKITKLRQHFQEKLRRL